MTKQPRIPASDEAWENGELGRDEAHVKRVEENLESKIDEALDLQLISIRLQKSLIDDFKIIAALHGINYQPLMRQVLKRFVECEKKQILREKISELANLPVKIQKEIEALLEEHKATNHSKKRKIA